MDYKERYNKWLNDSTIDSETKKELVKLNNKEIKDRFFKELSFGTAGLRERMGVGSNRINKYTILKVTQGIANYLKNLNLKEKAVVVGYDSRNNSFEYAKEVALCFSANGIKTYIFDTVVPTPLISFSVRELRCVVGIMITASHNAKEYNGYKVFGEDGGQIVSPYDTEIMKEINNIKEYSEIKTIKLGEAQEKSLYNAVGEEIKKTYIQKIKENVINIEEFKNQFKKIAVVYTPLYGVGGELVKKSLMEIGFNNLYIVEEQEKPDGDFPTLKYPNPENIKVFKKAIKLAKRVNAEIIIANDPDADRIAVCIKDKNKYRYLNGNQLGCLLLDYVLSQTANVKDVIIKTKVSTNMIDKICQNYNVQIEEVLTGFKNIGAKIKEYESDDNKKFIFGIEESNGILYGSNVRDKDGISAIVLTLESLLYYENRNMTLDKVLDKLYKKYGYYKESIITKQYKNVEELEKTEIILKNINEKGLQKIGEFKIIKIENILNSNTLYIKLENDAWICVRRSGTEPKMKVYFGVKGKTEKEAKNQIDKLSRNVKQLIK